MRRITLLLVLAALLTAEEPTEEPYDSALLEQTTALRTALYHDPTLDGPLDQLVAAYRGAGRIAELAQLYSDHLAAYPEDQGATIVHLRLLLAIGDPSSLRVAREACTSFPDEAYVHHLAWRAMQEHRDPEALNELERAASLETRAWRRRQWSAELVREALANGRKDLAERHLRTRAELETSADALAGIAQLLLDGGLPAAALEVLQSAQRQAPDSETTVDIELLAAAAETALDQRPAAAQRLDALAARLGPEHWRRAEVARRRLALASDEAEREALLTAVRARLASDDADEAAVLDGVRMLIECGHGAEAMAALRAAEQRLPASERIERELDAAFDRRRDEAGRAAWLADRQTAEPTRADLPWRRAAALALSGQTASSEALVDASLVTLAPEARCEVLSGLARQLRKASGTAATVPFFQRALREQPARLDLRRELGECLVALGRSREVRALFLDPQAQQAAATAPAELLLDALPFLERLHLTAEAEALINARLAVDDEHFELRLAAAHLARVLGEPRRADAILLRARALSDTSARYRTWIEQAFASDAGPEALASAVREEIARVLAEAQPWERAIITAEVARQLGQADAASELLSAIAASDLPDAAALAVKRALATCLGAMPGHEAEYLTALQDLADSDPEGRDGTLLRLALGPMDSGDEGYTFDPSVLADIDLTQVREVELLDRLLSLLRSAGATAEALSVAARLVELDGNSASRWQTWLSLLSSSDDERTFRIAVRRLLAGVDRLRPGPTARQLLARHLGDSCWRQVVRALAAQDPTLLTSALEALAELESGDPDAAERRWIPWTRALLAGRLGLTSLHDEARASFLRATTGEAIELPDGLTLQRAVALSLLEPRRPALPDRHLPIPPLAPTWVVDHGSPPSGLVTCQGNLIVADHSGLLTAYDLRGGRRRWMAAGLTQPGTPGQWDDSNNGYGWRSATRSMLACDQRSVFVINQRTISSIDPMDGHLRWQAETTFTITSLCAHVDEVIVVDRQAQVFAFAAESGKLRWTMSPELPIQSSATSTLSSIAWPNVLVYGQYVALIDLAERRLVWHVDGARVRAAQPALEEASAAAVVTAAIDPNTFAALGSPISTQNIDVRLVCGIALPALSGVTLYDLQLDGDGALLTTDHGIWYLSLAMPQAMVPLLVQSGGEATTAIGVWRGQIATVGWSGQLQLYALDAPPRTLVTRELSKGENTACRSAAMLVDGSVLYAVDREGLRGFSLPDGLPLFQEDFPTVIRQMFRGANATDSPLVTPMHAATADGLLVLSLDHYLIGLQDDRPHESGDVIP